jgi:mono/diheme cytochrome c family protein
MKRRLFCRSLAAVFAIVLGGCQSDLSSTAPPVTVAFVRAGTRPHADAATLTEGRRVYLNRCTQCHALPHVAKFDPPRLERIVAVMAGRASLSPEQHNAVLKYLLTARSQ